MAYGPGASYYTWLDYFTNVDLYYIEYDAACAKQWANKTEHATIFAGDQASAPFLQEFIDKTGGNFDVIIDDGGHTMDQQRTSLSVLWPHVKPSGIYFIEDLATSYIASFGGQYEGPNTMMGDLKSMLDDINRVAGHPDKSPISKDVSRFEFTQECAALTKRSDYSMPTKKREEDPSPKKRTVKNVLHSARDALVKLRRFLKRTERSIEVAEHSTIFWRRDLEL